VTLISGPVSLPTPPFVQRIDVTTALLLGASLDGRFHLPPAVSAADIPAWNGRRHGRQHSADQKLIYFFVMHCDIH
ncbi:hypothetical protein ACTXQV_76130, partial [Klebsiella pneumoniae]